VAVADLEGALVVVTGAASGIGRATALAFAGAGSRVVAVDIDAEGADKTAAACAELGVPAGGRRCDVADAGAVMELAEGVVDEVGVPDVVVNNAGVGLSGSLADMSLDDWRWIRSINLDGVVHGCRAFGPAMLRRGSGHVVNMSSGLAYTVGAGESAYSATKAAVLTLSRCLEADWAPQGVAVTAVCPGVINTPIIERARFAGAGGEERRADARRLFRRGHRPELVALAVVDAVRRRRVVVPVGWESRLGWAIQRVAPVRVGQLMARVGR
jgi:NAD(P)-dependent dehydrogenase (short-subunit alcohol dehydrogenase family)